MASVITADSVRSGNHAEASPFSLIEQKGLGSRLVQQLASAAGELARDPRGFIKDLFSANTKDARRSRRIRIGMACAVLAHCVLLVLIAVLGRTMISKGGEEPPMRGIMLPPSKLSSPGDKTEPPQHDIEKGDRGGGGGGQHNPLPPIKGTLPQMLPQPQIVSMNASNVPKATLPVEPNLVGAASLPPPPAPIGDPNGKSSEPSGGPGSKGGIGNGEGTGIGDGNDSGANKGSRGNKGGGPAGSPNGSGAVVPSAVDFNRIAAIQGYKTWSWIHRPRPIITPEAAAEKVIGVVLLRATFNADGTITDIELVMPVQFMNESAIEALRKSTFRPATINGLPVTVRRVPIQVSVHY